MKYSARNYPDKGQRHSIPALGPERQENHENDDKGLMLNKKLKMQSIFKLFVLMIFISIAQAVLAATTSRYFIILNTHPKDLRGHANLDLDEGQIIAELEKQYPKTNFVTIRSGDNNEIREKLKSYSDSSVTLDGLYIMSHGSSKKHLEKASKKSSTLVTADERMEENKFFYSQISSEDGRFKVNLASSSSVNKVFMPIIGKFTSGAKIIINGCQTIESGSERQKLIRMKQIADNFKLSDGSLYMNKTYGINAVSGILGQPFYEQSGAIDKLTTMATQAIWPITLPVYWIIDKFVANQGYLLRVRDSEASLSKDHQFNAARNKRSLGEQQGEFMTLEFEKIDDSRGKKNVPHNVTGKKESEKALQK